MQSQVSIATSPRPTSSSASTVGTSRPGTFTRPQPATFASGRSDGTTPLYPSPPMSKSPSPPRSFTTPNSSSQTTSLPATDRSGGTSATLAPHDQAQTPQRPLQTLQDPLGAHTRHVTYPQELPSPAAPLYATQASRFEDRPYSADTLHYGSSTNAATALPPTPRSVPPTRRTKTHVQSACFNCKKAHLSCDVNRPCNRCISAGKQDTCYDVEHKKRGRPRLRDERGNKVATAVSRTAPRSPSSATPVAAGPPHPQLEPRPSDSLRLLKSQDADQAARHAQYYQPVQSEPLYSTTAYHNSQSAENRYLAQPIAFLDMDLKIARTNSAFRNIFNLGFELYAKHMEVLVDQGDRIALQDMRRQLRDERDSTDPEFMSPIVPATDLDRIPPVEAVDLQRVSQSFGERPVPLRFRLPENHSATMMATLRLAKVDVYFVSLMLPPVPEAVSYQNVPYPQPRQGYHSYEMSTPYAFGSSFGNQQYNYGPPSHSQPAARPTGLSNTQSPFYNFQNIASSLPPATPTSLTQTRGAYETSYFYPPQYQVAPVPVYNYPHGNPNQANVPQADYRHTAYPTPQYQQNQGFSPHDPTTSGLQLPPISSDPPQIRQYAQRSDQPAPPQGRGEARGVVRRRETDSASEEDDSGRKRQRFNPNEVPD